MYKTRESGETRRADGPRSTAKGLINLCSRDVVSREIAAVFIVLYLIPSSSASRFNEQKEKKHQTPRTAVA